MPVRAIYANRRNAIFGWTALVIALCLAILFVLQTPAPGGATYDEKVLLAFNAGWARLPLETFQSVLLDNSLPELVLVGSIVLAWNTRRIGMFDRDGLRRRVLLAILALEPTYAIARVIQYLGHRPRPHDVLHLAPLAESHRWAVMSHAFTGFSSYPSDHAALSAIAAVIAFSIGRRCGWFFAIFGLYASAYRIAFGFHWPSDIVAGILIGTCVGATALLARPYLHRTFVRVLVAFRRYPAVSSVFAVLFLSEFGGGFSRLQNIFHELGYGRFFH